MNYQIGDTVWVLSTKKLLPIQAKIGEKYMKDGEAYFCLQEEEPDFAYAEWQIKKSKEEVENDKILFQIISQYKLREDLLDQAHYFNDVNMEILDAKITESLNKAIIFVIFLQIIVSVLFFM